MDRTKWKEIDAVLEQALELEPGDRANALSRICAGDEELRRRVEALLGQEGAAEEFLEASAFDYLALQLGEGPIGLTPGQQIGRFRIEQLIGEGGMGEVYLAEDPLLGRKVAIKLLPVHFNASSERVSRFEREARAAGSLSHENIIRVFDVGEFEGRHYIVTEHVAGENLRERMAGKPMNAPEAASIARQIAAALVAAHDAGVVHRDIKPENVMVQRDGIVKVLDFSLALLVGDEPRERAAGEAGGHVSGSEYATRFGAVMGTLRYMSPEQARGEVVDHRTDLFSLGVVMYELLTGQAPFTGKSADAVRTAILEHEPPFNLSSRWQRIVRRALGKSKTERYQTARELHDDLKVLLDAPAWLTRRAMIAGGLAAAASATGGLWFLTRGRGDARPPEIQTLSLDTNVEQAAVSPDGRRFAITEWKNNRRRLKVWDAATGNSIEILPPGFDRDCLSPTFAPDQQSIYFLAVDENSGWKELYRIAANGGSPRKIVDRINSPVVVSPDGRRLAFMRMSDDGAETALMVADENGGTPRQIAARRDPIKISLKKAAWSPDGKRIAFAAGTYGIEDDHQIYGVPADGGVERSLSKHNLRRLDDLVWLGDDSGMGMLGSEPDEIIGRIWHLSFAGDQLRELTGDTASFSCGYETLSAPARGGELFTVQWKMNGGLWVMPAFDSRQAKPMGPDGETAGRHGICWTPDGRIVYAGGSFKTQQIRMVDADGGNDRGLTSDEEDNDGPYMTRDGRYLVYCSARGSGYTNIWRMDRGSGEILQLSFGREDVEPRCSPDGRWVVFVAKAVGVGVSIRKVSIDGGESVPLAADCGANPSPTVSPDGKRLAYFRRVSREEGKRLEVISLNGPRSVGSPPLKTFKLPDSAYIPHWSHDGRSIIYAQTEDRTTNLWELSYEDGGQRRLTEFDSDEISWFALSLDGTQVALCRIKTIRDVVRISRFN